jgi:hypothetical protein
MTAAALIKSLKPGEVAIRCADGSLMQTVSTDLRFIEQRKPVDLRKLMRNLAVLKQGKKR